MGTGYATLWNAFKRITAGCSPTEKFALYGNTARQLYRIRCKTGEDAARPVRR